MADEIGADPNSWRHFYPRTNAAWLLDIVRDFRAELLPCKENVCGGSACICTKSENAARQMLKQIQKCYVDHMSAEEWLTALEHKLAGKPGCLGINLRQEIKRRIMSWEARPWRGC